VPMAHLPSAERSDGDPGWGRGKTFLSAQMCPPCPTPGGAINRAPTELCQEPDPLKGMGLREQVWT
jgi:hypothetical protein